MKKLAPYPRLSSRLPVLVGIWLSCSASAALAQTTYTWNGASGANFSAAASWTPSRSAPANTDILEFNGGTPSATLDAGATQTIGRIRFRNNTDATFSISTSNNLTTTRTLTIQATAADDDFIVDAGSTLTVVGNGSTGSSSASNFVASLNPGATARIAGSVVFSGVGGNANAASVHKFLGAAGSVVFQAGGSLTTQGATLDPTDTPFGTTTGLAVFQSGAGFIQQAGDDPYGPAAFQAGSTYTFSGGTAPGGSDLDGRTYGNLVFATSAALPTYTGTTRLNILNNLQLTATNTATLTLNLTGTSATTGIAVGGNIIVDGGTLQLNPGSDVNLTLNGATIQHIQGDGTFSISPTTVRLAIDNPGGVTLQKPLTFEGLVLTNGLLNTSVSSPLTIAIANQANSASFISGGSATSFVNGPLNITTSATGAKTFTFPIGALRNGTTNVYRPVTLTATQSSTAGSYTAVQTEGRAANLAPGTGIQRVSGLRYFTLSSVGTTFTNGAITLSFGSDDQADNASTLRVAQRVGSAWNNLGGTGTAVPTGTITSTTAFTTLTEFVLATSTADLSANPLPVELSSFTAERRGSDGLLRWTTAQEKNSAYFEVQRSLDGREFRALGRVQAQGTSTRASSYSFLDKGAAGPVYYRLHQVDRDGTASDSRIVVLGGTMAFTATAFPNPATDLLRVSTSAPVRAWRVLSPVGPPLLRGTGQPDRVPVSSLNPGVYLLELTTGGNGRHLLRFVRQ